MYLFDYRLHKEGMWPFLGLEYVPGWPDSPFKPSTIAWTHTGIFYISLHINFYGVMFRLLPTHITVLSGLCCKPWVGFHGTVASEVSFYFSVGFFKIGVSLLFIIRIIMVVSNFHHDVAVMLAWLCSTWKGLLWIRRLYCNNTVFIALDKPSVSWQRATYYFLINRMLKCWSTEVVLAVEIVALVKIVLQKRMCVLLLVKR